MDYVSVVCAQFVLGYASHAIFVDERNINEIPLHPVEYNAQGLMAAASMLIANISAQHFPITSLGIRRSGRIVLA